MGGPSPQAPHRGEPELDSGGGVFDPVVASSTFEEIVERLGVAIRLGTLPPGTRLPPERELAARMGISRATLRRAITTLVQSGNLRSTRGRGGGTFVVDEPPLAAPPAAPPREDWRDVLDTRMALELGCVALAAERATPEAVASLREQIAVMDAAEAFADYRRADAAFHLGIARATGVARLVTLATEAQADVSELLGRIANPPEVLRHANAEHAQLADALERHDRPAAEAILRRHLIGTQHIVAALLR